MDRSLKWKLNEQREEQYPDTWHNDDYLYRVRQANFPFFEYEMPYEKGS
jgi:hypothetical protein